MRGQLYPILFHLGGIKMQLAEKQSSSSWRSDDSPLILSDIFSEETSVAIWQRGVNAKINRYFTQVFPSLRLGVRGVYSINSLKDELSELLPEHEGRQEAVDDIYLLSDMLTCLFDCNSVGLRLAPLTSAMCPSFHVDDIPVRLVNTYVGSGTEWLPLEALHRHLPKAGGSHVSKTKFDLYYDESHIQQMESFDVGLLKGKAWQHQEHMAAVHRSCKLQESEQRVLLTLDPM